MLEHTYAYVVFGAPNNSPPLQPRCSGSGGSLDAAHGCLGRAPTPNPDHNPGSHTGLLQNQRPLGVATILEDQAPGP